MHLSQLNIELQKLYYNHFWSIFISVFLFLMVVWGNFQIAGIHSLSVIKKSVCGLCECLYMYVWKHIHLNSHCSSLASLCLVCVFLSLFPTLDISGLGLFLDLTIGLLLKYNRTRRAFLKGKPLASDLPKFDPGFKSSGIQLSQWAAREAHGDELCHFLENLLPLFLGHYTGLVMWFMWFTYYVSS